MKKIISTILVLSFLTSCVSTKNVALNSESAESLKNKKLVIVRSEKPDFAAVTFGNMMIAMFTGGILGTIKIIHDGNKIVKENSIEDPSIQMAQNLASQISSQYQVEIIKQEVAKEMDYDEEEIAKEYKDIANYALDLRTINWSFGYLPMRTNSFRVIYSSKIRLINTENSKIIAEGFCARIPDGSDYYPSYKELLANNAEVIKEELSKASLYCTDMFKEKVFTSLDK
jgi:hypothetical protein